jgi:predicted small secreted protein
MKMRKITVVATLLMLLTSVFVLSGCNTWKGLGKDVEKTGEGMQ